MTIRKRSFFEKVAQGIADAVFGSEEDQQRVYFAQHAYEYGTPGDLAAAQQPSGTPVTGDAAIVAAAMLDPSSGERYRVAPPPDTTFSTLKDLQDRVSATRAGSDTGNIRQLILDVTNAGDEYELDCDANGLMLLARTQANGTELESSDSARLYVEINRSSVWVPMSFNVITQGVQKGDQTFIGTKITHLRIRVQNQTQDQNQPVMIVLLVKDLTLMGPYGGASLYSSPTSSSGAGQGASAAVPGQSPAASTLPGSGGSGSGTSSGGTFSGGGGGGGGGLR